MVPVINASLQPALGEGVSRRRNDVRDGEADHHDKYDTELNDDVSMLYEKSSRQTSSCLLIREATIVCRERHCYG